MRLALLLLLLAPLTAGAITLPNGRSLELRPFQPAGHAAGVPPRELWRISAPDDYAYRLQRRCYCFGPKDARVYIVQKKVAAVEDLATGRVHSDKRILELFMPLADYFDLIDRLWERQPAIFEIRHDRRFGFPARILADPAYSIADDEVDLRIGELQGLEASPPR